MFQVWDFVLTKDDTQLVVGSVESELRLYDLVWLDEDGGTALDDEAVRTWDLCPWCPISMTNQLPLQDPESGIKRLRFGDPTGDDGEGADQANVS